MGKTKVKHDPPGELAERMIARLEAQRLGQPNEYPLTVTQLALLADPHAPAEIFRKAINKRKGFLDRVVIAKSRNGDSPLALANDLQILAESDQLLQFLLRSARTPTNQAWSVAELKNQVSTSLKNPFAVATNRRIDEDRLPEGIAWIWVKRTRRLFLLEDMHGRIQEWMARPEQREGRDGIPQSPGPSKSQGVPPDQGVAANLKRGEASPGMTVVDFAQLFDDAFEKLNRREGSANFVSLVDLRKALAAVPRQVFDAELWQLWSTGRYSLRAAEGRFGISPEEREAGFHQEGNLLLFVSRNP